MHAYTHILPPTYHPPTHTHTFSHPHTYTPTLSPTHLPTHPFSIDRVGLLGVPLHYPHLGGLQWYAFIGVTQDAESGGDDKTTEQGTHKDQGSNQGADKTDKGSDKDAVKEEDKKTDKDKGSNQGADKGSNQAAVARCMGYQGALGDPLGHATHRLALLQRQVPGLALQHTFSFFIILTST